VSTPPDPRSGGQQPGDASGAAGSGSGSGQPGSTGQYGQQTYGQPGQHGQQPYNPYAQQGQAGGQSPYGQPGQYNPYGQPQPYSPYSQPGQYAGTPFGSEAAGLGPDDTKRVARPGIMVVSLVLLVLSTVPFLLGGVAFLMAPSDPSQLPPELAPPAGFLEENGITAEQYVGIVRILGGLILALALVYALFALIAFMGRNWARITLTIMTVGFTLVLLSSMLVGAAAVPAGFGVILVIAAAAVGGTIIMFLPEPTRWFRSVR
jgi:hypothetical protein